MTVQGGIFQNMRNKLTDSEIVQQINVTSSELYDTNVNALCDGRSVYQQPPYVLIQGNHPTSFHTKRYTYGWVSFDLKRNAKIDGLALKGTGTGCAYLKEFYLQGSRDGNNWDVIMYESTNKLSIKGEWHIFQCPQSTFRYFRIFQDQTLTSSSKGSDLYFELFAIDFIGSFESSISPFSCNDQIYWISLLHIFPLISTIFIYL